VPAHGFTAEALALGARDAGLLDISPSILPDGVFGLIRWHLYLQRTSLAGRVAGVERVGTMTVAERVEALAWERLRGNEGVVGRWQEVSFFLIFFFFELDREVDGWIWMMILTV
jgi:ubiquinone biosynthesis protein COQ9